MVNQKLFLWVDLQYKFVALHFSNLQSRETMAAPYRGNITGDHKRDFEIIASIKKFNLPSIKDRRARRVNKSQIGGCNRGNRLLIINANYCSI